MAFWFARKRAAREMLRFDRLHFCGANAPLFLHKLQKTKRKCNRHGGGTAAGVSRRFSPLYFIILTHFCGSKGPTQI